MKRGWICDGCNHGSISAPWNCPGCGTEVCEGCFDMFGHCKSCCRGKSKQTLAEAANQHGFDFEPGDYPLDIIID